MTILDDVKTFPDKVTSEIQEVPQFIQSNISHEEIRQIKWLHHKSINTNIANAITKNGNSLYRYDGDWIVQEDAFSFACLMMIHIDETCTLYNDNEFKTKVKSFCMDLSRNLPKVYKEYGFARKRKLTLELLQEQLENDKFTFDCLIYISKLIKKNICLLSVSKTKTSVSFEREESEASDVDEWILFIHNENDTYLKKSMKLLKLEEINLIAASIVQPPSKRTKAYEKFIGSSK